MRQQRRPSSRFVWKLTAALYAALLVAILVTAYTGNLPPQLEQIPNYDKILHLVLYGIASFLGHRVFNYRRVSVWKMAVPLFPLLFGLFTVTEEGLQFFSPNRSLDAWDLVMSFIGIGLGYWLAEAGRPSAKADQPDQ